MYPNQTPNTSNRLRLVAIAVAVVLGIIALLITLFGGDTTTTVTITTEDGAEIFTAKEPGGERTSVGTTAVEVEVAVPSKLYVWIEEGTRQAQTGLVITDEQPREVNVPLVEQSLAYQQLYQGAVSDVLLYSDNTAAGIEPSNDVITSFGTKEFKPLRAEFVGIPFLQKIIWTNQNNFNMLTFRSGVQIFKGGEVVSNNQFGKTIVDQNGNDYDAGQAGADIATNVEDTAGDSDVTYFLTASDIFSSTNLGQKLTHVTNYDDNAAFQSVAATNQSLFRLSAPSPAAYAGETETEGAQVPVSVANIIRYSSSGEKLNETEVAGGNLIDAAATENTECVLSNAELVCVNDDNTRVIPLYTVVNADIISHRNQIYVLADSGLWRVSADGESLAAIVDFSGVGVGLQRSMTINNNQLVFGTQLPPNETSSEIIPATYVAEQL